MSLPGEFPWLLSLVFEKYFDKSTQKLTAALWTSSAICGGLPFLRAGRPDNGN